MSEFNDVVDVIQNLVDSKIEEGIVANTDKETEVNAIKKLTEEEEFVEEPETSEDGGFHTVVELEGSNGTVEIIGNPDSTYQLITKEGDEEHLLATGKWSGAGLMDLEIVEEYEFAQVVGNLFLTAAGEIM